MASKKISHERLANYLFDCSNENSQLNTHSFDFNESDLWSIPNVSTVETKNIIPPSRNALNIVWVNKKNHRNHYNHTCGSLPVNIPDWSRIYNSNVNGGANPGNHSVDYEEDEENDDDGHDQEGRVPPHEYLARRRGASFSVHEGIGRTLKGRDLSQFRNAIWKQVGFED